MNLEALPDEARTALRKLGNQLDRTPFHGDEATYEGIKFVVATVGDRLPNSNRSTLYMSLQELLFDWEKRRRIGRSVPRED